MKMSEVGLALIRRFEGFSPSVYRCPAGLLTIGYGHVVRAWEQFDAVDEGQAQLLLTNDVRIAEASVMRLISVTLTQGQFDALVSFTFNLGGGALQRSRLRRRVNEAEHGAVPGELMRWVFAGGRPLEGLVLRRRAEAKLYQGL